MLILQPTTTRLPSSAIITLLDSSIKIDDSAQDDIWLSTIFGIVRRRPQSSFILWRRARIHLKSRKYPIPEDVCKALEKTLDTCDVKASNLRSIFEKVVPGQNNAWEKRYSKFLRRLSKRSKVEELMRSITEDVQLIANHNAVRSANSQQGLEYDNIIKELNSIDSWVLDEESSGMTFVNNHVYRGHGTYHVNSGNGRQFNAQHHSFGKV
ncbi:hypothetical protein N7445_003531 [Penicillium cf. griseofulvum]|nr:hypothetical protein N7445_003531 [Penicillium cf. griseofulvum]